jgi:hypothetical protein
LGDVGRNPQGGFSRRRGDSRLFSRLPSLAPPMHQGLAMSDLVFVIATVAFFALGIAYTRACDHL